MKKSERTFMSLFLELYIKFEQVITIVLAGIISCIILISLVRIVENFYTLFAGDFFSPEEITFEDYQQIFGKIMTLLISLEFMSSILKVLKTHEIKTLVQDVVLITALAVARKLIIFDYDNHDPASTIVLGGILISIGVFYFLIKFGKNERESDEKENLSILEKNNPG